MEDSNRNLQGKVDGVQISKYSNTEVEKCDNPWYNSFSYPILMKAINDN